MTKKLLALALIGGAVALLYKTKKGAEIRKEAGDLAGKAVQALKEKYATLAGAVTDHLDAQTA